MMIDAHLTDGRTTLRFASRGPLITLVQRDPTTLDTNTSVRCWINRGQGEGFLPCRLQYVRKHTLGWVEQLDHEMSATFLAEHAPELERKRVA